uniref:Major facilitator superfamily associated domain-containing protein n=1 Tax=Chromera velia CCMP2878 TaxID=1169474 RepID=A0A0G4HBK1_9ALVE|eukprot:Cvel_25874.t1-p1 / transcript=Cvel_25874.t1 / gene=Cvel_25874 / organism=Chromera_velia_CCMP2878 / gene_product=Major facilitator superfamily domain-containing, putative / transcript_product=Major facilitator superfamily domain-containing, putative / location=Cvel_scaffold2986:16218-17912(+) / protein_length=565 / sequence_SO=supercontig / SO=protein_coding / is_pseudo=false
MPEETASSSGESDAGLWQVKLLYFLNSASSACFFRYDTVFYYYIGLSPGQIGIIKATQPLVGFCGNIFWTRLADVTGMFKGLLLITNVIAVCLWCTLLLPFVHDKFWKILVLVVVASFINAAFGPICDTIVLHAVSKSTSSESYGQQRMWAAVGWGSFAFATGFLLDRVGVPVMFEGYVAGQAAVLALLWFGFQSAETNGPSGGHAVAPLGDEETDDVSKTWRPDLSSAVSALDVDGKIEEEGEGGGNGSVSVRRERPAMRVEGDLRESLLASDDESGEGEGRYAEEGRGAEGLTDEEKRLGEGGLFSFPVVWLCLNMIIFGCAMALVEQFLFIYLLHEFRDADDTLLGVVILTMTIFEIPMFYFEDNLMRALGHRGVLTLAHLTYAIRLVYYTAIPRSNGWLVLVVEPFHGVTYAAMWSASVRYGQMLAPKGKEATVQGLVSGTYTGLGMGLGSLWGGMLWDRFGPNWTFRVTAVAVVGWSLIFNLFFNCGRERDRREGDVRCHGGRRWPPWWCVVCSCGCGGVFDCLGVRGSRGGSWWGWWGEVVSEDVDRERGQIQSPRSRD